MEPGTLLEVARIARSHGLAGEVVVDLVTNRPERLAPGTPLTSRRNGAERVLVVASARPFGRRHLVRFEHVTTREAADALHGAVLFAPPVSDPEALFVHDLVGRTLVDQHGEARGVVTGVEANPASDLLVVDGRHYVPARFVVGLRPGSVDVDVPDGIFDV